MPRPPRKLSRELCILGLGEGPKNFIAPNCGPHKAAALQESMDIYLTGEARAVVRVGGWEWGGEE